MPYHLADLYHRVAADAAATIVCKEARRSLGEILDTTPSHGDTFGFEIRLAEGDRRADLGIGLSLKSGADVFLAEPAANDALARAIGLDERWDRLHRFGERWKNDPAWRTRAPFLFLEYDDDAPRTPIPVPSVFVALDWPLEELRPEARRAGREGAFDSTPGLSDVLEMLSTLRREPLPTATSDLLAQCFALMPDGGVILHLAVMLGRPGEGVRLSLYVPRRDALTYMASLGWTEGRAALERALGFQPGGPDSPAPVQIDVDLQATLGDAIGVTLLPLSQDEWHVLLDELITAGLCAPEKGEALVAWPGVSTALDGTAIERYLAHAKITCGADITPRAKAYIGVRWRAR